MRSNFTSIDEYIGTFPPETQKILEDLRALIHECAPQASEKISYQMPTFYQDGNLVHFAAYGKHIGLYPTSSGVSAFENDLKAYKTSKGAIQFPIDKPLPVDLIRRIVKFRLEENTALAAAKRRAKR